MMLFRKRPKKEASIKNFIGGGIVNEDTRRLTLLNLEAELLEANLKAEEAALRLKYEKLRQKAEKESESNGNPYPKDMTDELRRGLIVNYKI